MKYLELEDLQKDTERAREERERHKTVRATGHTDNPSKKKKKDRRRERRDAGCVMVGTCSVDQVTGIHHMDPNPHPFTDQVCLDQVTRFYSTVAQIQKVI